MSRNARFRPIRLRCFCRRLRTSLFPDLRIRSSFACMEIVVKKDARGATLDWGAGAKRCAIGRGGIGAKGGEGDGITPIGTFPVRRVLYRPDRVSLRTKLPASAIAENDGWCDAPDDPNYNMPVKLPYAASHEH